MRVSTRSIILAALGADVALLLLCAAAAIAQSAYGLQGVTLAAWLDGRGGMALMPLIATKFTLIALLHTRERRLWPLAAGWGWIAIAKTFSLHLAIAPALSVHLLMLADMSGIPSGALGKIAAMAAIALIAMGCFVMAFGQARVLSILAFAAVVLLAVVSAGPEMVARIAEPDVWHLPLVGIELAGECLATTLLLAIICRQSAPLVAGERHSQPLGGVSVGSSLSH